MKTTSVQLMMVILALSGLVSFEVQAKVRLPKNAKKILSDRARWRKVDQEIAQNPALAGEDPIDPAAVSPDRLTQDQSQFQSSPKRDLGIFDIQSFDPAASEEDSHVALMSTRMTIHIFKRPVGLTADDEPSIDYEFGVAELDGALMSVFAISSAKSGHKTIVVRDQSLSIERDSGYPYPFHRSSSYENSPMFWGLQIDGAYWIHATPHYGFLGQPASMGCVRVSYPTAMELWDTAVNTTSRSAKINIYGSGTNSQVAAYQDLRERFNLPPSEINRWVEADLRDAHEISEGDYSGNGHWRITPNRILDRFETGYYPKCKGEDCFSVFGKHKQVAN